MLCCSRTRERQWNCSHALSAVFVWGLFGLGVGPALDGGLQQLCPILQRLPMTATIEDAAGKKLKFRGEERPCSRSAPDGILSDQVPPMIGQRNRKGTLVTRRAELLKLLIFAQGQERNQEQGRRIDNLSICPSTWKYVMSCRGRARE